MTLPSWWKLPGQKQVLFVAGLLGFAHETLVTDGVRWGLLIFFGTMVGLPAFMKLDERTPPSLPPTPPAPAAEESQR